MKFIQSILLLVTAALTIPSTLADFHIVQGIAPGGGAGLEACPSNYYNCKCLKDGDRAAQVIVNDKGVGSLPDNFFSVKAGFCGMGKLDFWKRGDGHWDIYQSGGDGSAQGTCYGNTAGTNCSPGFFFNDQLVCYSYICGS